MKIPPPEEFCKLAFLRYLLSEIGTMSLEDATFFISDYSDVLQFYASESIYTTTFKEGVPRRKLHYPTFHDFKFTMTQYLNQPHNGDCTSVACSCDRCEAEEYFMEYLK